METDKTMMNRCFDLAMNGLGKVSPNPLVGAVIVKDDKIIGEGYHREYGGPHAEVNAIRSVIDHELLQGSTLFVNLEPCSHYGKTPPCTLLIIEKGISRVVISHVDPYHEVAGRGIAILRDAGIQVETGVLSEEGKYLNRRFLTFHTLKRPYIILKWAQTQDGFMDIDRKDPLAISRWITNESSKVLVHKWRTEEDSIIVGFQTALTDNPILNAREYSGRNPLRIFLDRNLELPDNHHLLDGTIPTLILTGKRQNKKGVTEYGMIDFDHDLPEQINHILYTKGIQSLMVEGGRKLLDLYLKSGLWDEARVLQGSCHFHQGLEAPKMGISPRETVALGSDLVHYFTHPGKYSQGI